MHPWWLYHKVIHGPNVGMLSLVMKYWHQHPNENSTTFFRATGQMIEYYKYTFTSFWISSKDGYLGMTPDHEQVMFGILVRSYVFPTDCPDLSFGKIAIYSRCQRKVRLWDWKKNTCDLKTASKIRCDTLDLSIYFNSHLSSLPLHV